MSADNTSVVLAHGAWADGSSWAKVIGALVAAGQKTWAVPLPLTSFDADVEALERTLERAPGSIVLVAHAYAAFAEAFAPNATAEEQAVLAAVQRPLSPACISTAVPRPRWRDLPSWFLIAEGDYMILPETQRFMAQRMHAQVRSHPVDHTPIVTAPAVVVALIREAIAAVDAR
jgi:pimeloyl-ACP methyl ester carboxylesterase